MYKLHSDPIQTAQTQYKHTDSVQIHWIRSLKSTSKEWEKERKKQKLVINLKTCLKCFHLIMDSNGCNAFNCKCSCDAITNHLHVILFIAGYGIFKWHRKIIRKWNSELISGWNREIHIKMAQKIKAPFYHISLSNCECSSYLSLFELAIL